MKRWCLGGRQHKSVYPVMKFKLWERFSGECLEVSESMEVNGKRTFGYDDPIIYKRV